MAAAMSGCAFSPTKSPEQVTIDGVTLVPVEDVSDQ
jgi:hypothetical protein